MIKLPETIAAYSDECRAILSWLKGGPIDQDEFDRRSFEWRSADVPRSVHIFTGGTMILPMWGDPLLAILQEMMCAGLVTASKRKGLIQYALTP